MAVPQNLIKEENYHMIQQPQSWIPTQQNGKQGVRDICTPMFTAALFNHQRVEATQVDT